MKNKILKTSLNTLNTALVVLIVGGILSVAYLIAQKSSPKIRNSIGVNQQINYQGRLLTNTGAVVPDGTYNIEFKISQDGDGVLGGGDETLKWTETRTGGNKVQVKNGYFSVYLGAITAFGSSVDWNQDTLWLSINIGGTGAPSWDGEMTPFTRFSSTPYALNSKALGGLASSDFVQLGRGTQTDASTNTSISIDKTNTGNLLDLLNNGISAFTIGNDGSTTIKPVANSTNAFQILNAQAEQILNVDTTATNNLVTNPNFETVDTDWTGHGGSISQSVAQAYIGNGSLRVDTGNADYGAQYNPPSGLSSNTTYTFSFYGKLDPTVSWNNSFTTLNVGYSDDGVTDTADCLTGQTMTGTGWSRYTCTFTTGTISGSPYVYIKQTDAALRAFYIDGAQLTTYTNLVTNSDLETNATGWTGYGSGVTSQNATQAKTGTKSLRIISSGIEGGATYTYAFQPDTEYTISLYAKLDAGSSPAPYAIGKSVEFGSSSTDHVGCNSDTPSATEWKLFTCTFTTSSSLRGGPYFTFNRLTSPGSTTVYIDTVSLSVGKTNPTAFELGKISLNGIIASPSVFQNAYDSTTAFQIQNSAGSSNLLLADTLNNRVAIGKPSADYTLDVDGDVNVTAGSVYRMNGVDINTAGTLNNVAYLSSNNTFSGTNTFKTSTNSTTAFQVQNSGSDSLISVDNATTPNLITNPSFEVNTTGWTQRTSATLSRITSDKYVGTASMQVAAGSSAGHGVRYVYNLASSTTYSFSFYAKATGTFTTMQVGRSDDGLTGSEINCLSGQTVSTTVWARYTCTFTTGTTSGSRYVYISHSDASAHTYYIDGVQLEAAASASAFKLGTVGIDGIINSHVTAQNSVDSATSFQIQNAAGSSVVFNADTINGRVGIGTSAPAYALDVAGDVNIGGGNSYRIGTTAVCTSSGCAVDGASGIKNQTTSQTNANFNIQSAGDALVTAAIKARASQTADLLQILNSSAVKLTAIGPDGSITANAVATGTTATTSGTGTNTTTVTLTGSAFTNDDVILIDNAGQDYYTRIVSGGGTSTLTVSPAVTFETSRTVTKYNIQNIGATTGDYSTQANRFFQGYFLGGVVTGAGSTTLSDGRLQSTTPINFNSPNFTFQNTSNSVNAFQIQNAGGEKVINFDTSSISNLLSNGNFEINATGWTAVGSAGTPTQTTAQHQLGSGSLSFTTTAAAGDGAKFNYALASQTTYTMTFYAKSSSLTSTTSTVNIGRSEDGSTDTDCATGQSINGGGWSRITCVFTTGNVTGTDYIYLKQGDTTAKTIYVDSVMLETSNTLTINTDFETDVLNWNDYGSITRTQSTSEAYSGSASMRVETLNDNSLAGPSQTSFTGSLQPNTNYTASFWIKTDAATVGAKSFSIYKRFDTIDAGAGTVCGSKSVSVGVWTNVSCSFTTGSILNSSPFISINTVDDGITPIIFYMDNVGLSAVKYSTNDIGRISLNGAIDSPVTVRGQDAVGALLVQQQNGKTVLAVDTLNGFVGIGTDAPTKTLQVEGKVLFRATNSDTDTFQVTNTATIGATNSVIFNVAGNSRIVSVGLSPHTVNTALNVYGTSLINTRVNNANALRITDNLGTTALSFSTISGNRRLTIGGTEVTNNNDGKLSIVSTNGDTAFEVDSSGAGYTNVTVDDFQVNGVTSGLPLIAADGVNGFVGIGGFGAAHTLDVFGDTNSLGYLINGTAGATTTCTSGQFLQNQVASSGLTVGGSCANAVTTVGALGGSIANGASISGNTITFGAADNTNPGMVTSSGTQTFGGDKIFNGNVSTSGSATITSAGLLTGNAGLTVSGGTATINTSANDTSIGNASGILTITGSSSSTIVFGGTTISATELNLLDGHNVALVDTDDAVTTAITGTGILGGGSIASGFGAIDVGNDGITTTGTIGTAGSTTFTGNTLTLTGALAANGGITFNNSTDTLGAFTLAGTLDASTQLITNIGNAGTDFTSAGGLNLASDLSVTGDIFASHRLYAPGLSGTNGEGFFTGNSTTTLGVLQSLDLAGNTYTIFGNNKYFNGTAWVDSGLSRAGASFQIQNDSFTFYSFDAGVNITPRFTVASGGNVGVGLSGAPASLFSVGGTTGNFLVTSSGNTTIGGGLTMNKSNVGFTSEPDPGAPTVAVNVSAGNLNGSYTYCVVLVTALGTTECGTVSSAVAPVSQQVNLTAIPTGTANVVTARKIYRAKAYSGGTTYFNYQLVTTINDNTTTTYTDNIADGSVGALAPYSNNTAGLGIASSAPGDLIVGGGPWVDARAFGAKCDNITDDSTAIQTAINSVARTGGTVQLPIGQCIINTTLTINDSTVTLRGQGAYGNDDISAASSKGTALIAGASWTAANPLVRVTPPTTGATKPAIKRIAINNINFECAGRADYGLQLISTQYSSIRDLYFRNCGKVNLDLDTMAGALGEATDTTRNEFSNINIRTIDGSLTNTTINGAGSLPTGTITVVSTTGFNAGANSLAIFAGQSSPQYVNCTGTTATTFTGCSGGTGTLAVGQRVAVYGPGSAAGIRLNGSPSASPAGNTSVNNFNNIQILYGHGTAIMFDNSDSNRFYGVSLNRGNNTGIGVEFGAGTSAADSSRANVFYAFDQGPPGTSPSEQVVARGTQSSTVAAQNNQFFGFSRENGTALPTIETGAVLYLVTDRDYESRLFSNNFGSLMAGGAFIDNNSTYRQEFASDLQTANSTADSAAAGDDGQWYVDLSTAVSVDSWNQGDVAGGVLRLNAGTTTTRGLLLGFGSAQNNLSLVFSKARLPVVQMKVKAGINNATNDFFWGMMDQATAPTANDTKPANGIYFWNNNATGGWQGVVRSGAADVGTVNCPGAVSTTQFAVGRIQVESSSSVRFLIDNDASDGVSFLDCGTVGVNTNPTAALGLASYVVHTETTGRTFEIDYMSFWQDDDAPIEGVSIVDETADNSSQQGLQLDNTATESFDARVALADIMTSADNTYDPSRRFDIQTIVASGGIVARDITTDKLSVNNIEVATGSDINMKLSDDGNFVIAGADGEQKITFDGQGNANFAGTITADKIKASQIEGLEIFTNRISAVPTPSSQSQPEPETTDNVTNNTTQPSTPAPVQFGDITVNSAKVTLNIDVNGIITTAGLTVNGPAEFHGNTTFYRLVTFVEKTVFNNDIDFVGRATFNNDTAGFAVIQPGQTQVHVDFTRPYDQLPVVTLSVKNGQFVQYAYKDLTATGFTIVVEQPTTTPIEFSWNALSIKNAKTSSNP